ncbi:hypothetical protein WA538_003977 [Blastocystis sp. DL]
MAAPPPQGQMDIPVIVKRFKSYVLSECRDQLMVIMAHSDGTKHFGVYVSIQDLFSVDPELGNVVLNRSLQTTSLMDIALKEAQEAIYNVLPDDDGRSMLSIKELCHCRVYDLPPVPEFHKPSVGLIRSADLGRLVQFSGTVLRTGSIKMLEAEKEFECQNNRCRCRFKVKADIEQGGTMELPTKCPSNGSRGKCKSTVFKPVEGTVVCCDYQEIQVQERIQMLKVGTMPRSISVILLNDLVDMCKAGDDIVITGVVRQRWKPLIRDGTCEVGMIVVGLSVRLVSEKDNDRFLTDELVQKFQKYWQFFYQIQQRPFLGRNIIVSSICPNLYGLYLVKLSLLLILIGGVSNRSSEKNPVRGQSHLLVVGDSSTGKSQLLLFASKIAIRSVMTTGLGTTSAGLTCSAVRDGGEWMLEGGALVLGDRGVCCIDDFNSIREHDRATIHEAMEQQRLSVAKAGIMTTLNTRTIVIATCNPRGKYDVSQDLSVNTSIASPLLSRFDLILLLLDNSNKKWDSEVVNFVLNSNINMSSDGFKYSARYRSPLWSVDELKGYILFVQRTFHPFLSAPAQLIFTRYYQYVRGHNTSGTPATVRLLESLVRLGQAHARLMMRDRVVTMDAVVAVLLMEASVLGTGLLDINNLLYVDFPTDCEAEYLNLESQVLVKLGLDGDVSPTRFDEFQEVAVEKEGEAQRGDVLSVKAAEVSSVNSPPVKSVESQSPVRSMPSSVRSTSMPQSPMKPASIHQSPMKPASIHQSPMKPASIHQSPIKPSSIPPMKPTTISQSPIKPSLHQSPIKPASIHQPPIRPPSPQNPTPSPMKPPMNPTSQPTPHLPTPVSQPTLPQSTNLTTQTYSQQLSFDAEDEELIRLLEQEEASMSQANAQSKDVAKLLPHSEIERLFDVSQVEQSQNSTLPLESSLREDVFRLSVDRPSEEQSHDLEQPAPVSLTFDDMDDLIGDDLKGFL